MKFVLLDHEFVGLSDAREALTLLERGEHFDVIFSDMMMPEMTGMEFYEALLARKPELARRVVFLTGGAVDARVQDFLSVVPNTRIEKPFDNAALRRFVLELPSDHV